MFQYDNNGEKVLVEHYQPPLEKTDHNMVENFHFPKGKCPQWVWWVLIAVAGVLLVALIVVMAKNKGKNNNAETDSDVDSVPAQFGFRFY